MGKSRSRTKNPQAGDWYWFDYAPEEKSVAAGKVERCPGCHRTMKENDFILTAPVK